MDEIGMDEVAMDEFFHNQLPPAPRHKQAKSQPASKPQASKALIFGAVGGMIAVALTFAIVVALVNRDSNSASAGQSEALATTVGIATTAPPTTQPQTAPTQSDAAADAFAAQVVGHAKAGTLSKVVYDDNNPEPIKQLLLEVSPNLIGNNYTNVQTARYTDNTIYIYQDSDAAAGQYFGFIVNTKIGRVSHITFGPTKTEVTDYLWPIADPSGLKPTS